MLGFLRKSVFHVLLRIREKENNETLENSLGETQTEPEAATAAIEKLLQRFQKPPVVTMGPPSCVVRAALRPKSTSRASFRHVGPRTAHALQTSTLYSKSIKSIDSCAVVH